MTVGYRSGAPLKGASRSRQPTAIQINDSSGIVNETHEIPLVLTNRLSEFRQL